MDDTRIIDTDEATAEGADRENDNILSSNYKLLDDSDFNHNEKDGPNNGANDNDDDETAAAAAVEETNDEYYDEESGSNKNGSGANSHKLMKKKEKSTKSKLTDNGWRSNDGDNKLSSKGEGE